MAHVTAKWLSKQALQPDYPAHPDPSSVALASFSASLGFSFLICKMGCYLAFVSSKENLHTQILSTVAGIYSSQ